jgi:hypothetical protein
MSEQLFYFAQINDLHVQAADPTLPYVEPYPLANERAHWLIDAINKESFCPLPEFVIGLGDMIDGDILERLAPDQEFFSEVIAPLRCPFYPVVGNHEVVQQEHSPQHLQAYIAAYGENRVNYTFDWGGVLFIAVNNSGGDNPDNGAIRRKWLQQVLRSNRERPKILLCHIPLLPLREETVLAESFGFSSYKDADPGMLSLVEEYSETVIAVLSGHLHLTGMQVRKGIVHLSLSGTASYPCDGAVVYDVYADRIVATIHEIPYNLAQVSPTIHGKPRHDRDFTDAGHLTAQQYQRGVEGERRFVIDLPPAKRLDVSRPDVSASRRSS